ncbi:MAG: VCBS domain-containing protein, partial [Betaproteobacteria bacterium]
NVKTNDTLGDGTAAQNTITWGAQAATYGSITKNADGSYSYSLNNALTSVQQLRAGDTLNETFSYTLTDKDGDTSIANLVITITGTNDTPLAVADSGAALEAGGTGNALAGSPATGNVLSNDSDPDAGDTLTVSGLGGGAVGNSLSGNYGTLVLNANGSYRYVVDDANAAVQALRTTANTVTDSFTYTLRDASGATATATLSITVRGANDAPVATGNYAHTVSDTTTTVTGTLAATDVDTGDTLTWSGGGAGSYGTLTVSASGAYSYAANVSALAGVPAGETRTDSFTVTVTDAGGLTDTRTIQILASGAEHAVPTVVSLTTDIGTPTLTGGVTPLHTGETLSIVVNGRTYIPVVSGNSWTIVIPSESALPDGVYAITAVVSDTRGYNGTALGSVTVARATVPVLPPAPLPDPLPVAPSTFVTPVVTPTPVESPATAAFRPVDPVLTGQPVNIAGSLGGTPPAGPAPSADVNALPAPAAGNPPASSPLVSVVPEGFQIARITELSDPARAAELASITAGRLFVLEGVPDVQAGDSFQLPMEAFAHTDAGAVIKLEARQSNGDPLPAWLRFNNADGTFSGTPPEGQPAAVEVQVVARDNQAREASVIFKLELGVANPVATGAQGGLLDSNSSGFAVTRVGNSAALAEQGRLADSVSSGSDRLFVLEGVRNAVAEQRFQLPKEAFAHTDNSAVVRLEARLANGEALPAWLVFDPVSGIFRGTPPDGQPISLELVVIARDNAAREATAVFTLEMGVPGADAPAGQPAGGTTGTGEARPQGGRPTGDSTGSAPIQPGASLSSDALALGMSQRAFDVISIGSTGAGGRGFAIARVPADTFLPVSVDGQAVPEQRLFVYQGMLSARGLNEFRIPANAFGHTDPSAVVLLDARMADGSSLPPWLRFDSVLGIFRGTPPGGVRTAIEIILTARDEEGREANLSFTLELGVQPGEADAAQAEVPVPADRAMAKVDDAEADEAVEIAQADGKPGEKGEKAKPVRVGATPFGEQVKAAKVTRDPLLAKILAADKGGDNTKGQQRVVPPIL